MRTRGSLRGGVSDPGKKELQPGLPIAGGPNSIEEFVISLAVGLEVETQVQDRLPARAGGTQQNVMSSRPNRPLPSRNGWIVSN